MAAQLRKWRTGGFFDLQLVLQNLIPNDVLWRRFNYISNLRGMTKGRAQYSMQLERYEPVPSHIQEKIIAGINVAA